MAAASVPGPPGPELGSYTQCQGHQSLTNSDSVSSAPNPSQQQAWDNSIAGFMRFFSPEVYEEGTVKCLVCIQQGTRPGPESQS